MFVSLAQIAAQSGTNTGLIVAIAGGTGVATSAVVAFFASLYGHRREDRRVREGWLRDKRLEAYLAYEAAVLEFEAAARRARADSGKPALRRRRGTPPDSVALWQQINLANTRLMMLGPDTVRDTVDTMQKRLGTAWRAGEVAPPDISEDFGQAVEDVLGTKSKSRRWLRQDPATDAIQTSRRDELRGARVYPRGLRPRAGEHDGCAGQVERASVPTLRP